ncbi:putative anthocyanidin reductase [Mangifera indica]|uniref:putative anthocyanidin reductase n=1 Tax=Mangifera indica TaxID=29780 RepID=UPI001CFA886D|nr:putative anthocyanidin reductase [Mangifera indica]
MEDVVNMVECKREGAKTYCVTGATGYIGSWLVESLLEKGCIVHATVRDPAKIPHFLSLWTGCDRLRLFEADLQVEGSFNDAVKGCDGVFHVAASMEFDIPEKHNIETYVQSNIIDPAIRGKLNLLKACLNYESVKRVVLTSSISTITAKDSEGTWRSVVDESCQTPIDQVWSTKASGWVYVLSKLLTEQAAFEFAKENNIDLVSVITTTVAGPFLTSSVPSSIRVLLSPITGDSKFISILSAVNTRMGSVALVHIEDICNAHIFLMGNARAEGRYMCCAKSCLMSELVKHLNRVYPSSNLQKFNGENHSAVPSEISSEKLKSLGFTYKHGIEDIICQTIDYCMDCGFLSPIIKQC